MSYKYIRKPKVTETYLLPPLGQERKEELRRARQRAKELGIKRFILDGAEDVTNTTVQKYEQYIISTFIEKDIEVPQDVKKKLYELREQAKSNIKLD